MATSNKRTYLNCPYAEKDECKSLGGRWDKDRKKWYVPEGMDVEPFQKWLPSQSAKGGSKAVEPFWFSS